MADREEQGREALAVIREALVDAIVGAELEDQARAANGSLVSLTSEYEANLRTAAGRMFDDTLKAHDAEVAAAVLRKWIEHPGLAMGSWHPGPAALCDPFCAEALGSASDRVAGSGHR